MQTTNTKTIYQKFYDFFNNYNDTNFKENISIALTKEICTINNWTYKKSKDTLFDCIINQKLTELKIGGVKQNTTQSYHFLTKQLEHKDFMIWIFYISKKGIFLDVLNNSKFKNKYKIRDVLNEKQIDINKAKRDKIENLDENAKMISIENYLKTDLNKSILIEKILTKIIKTISSTNKFSKESLNYGFSKLKNFEKNDYFKNILKNKLQLINTKNIFRTATIHNNNRFYWASFKKSNKLIINKEKDETIYYLLFGITKNKTYFQIFRNDDIFITKSFNKKYEHNKYEYNYYNINESFQNFKNKYHAIQIQKGKNEYDSNKISNLINQKIQNKGDNK